MEEKTVFVPNISCGHCVMNIRRELGELDGVDSVAGDPESKQITVRWQPPATWVSITELLQELGYPAAA